MFTVKSKTLVLTIEADQLAESPRISMDNIGNMYCWHKRYNLGDEHHFPMPEDFRQSMEEEYGKNWKKKVVILPLYLYDHSGITMRTFPFSCRWDSGQVGWIWADKSDLRKEFPKKIRESAKDWERRMEECLRSEVATYDQFIRGGVVQYAVTDNDGTVIDSLCGIYLDDSRDAIDQIMTDYLEYEGVLTKGQLDELKAAIAA
mgnify:CR=1 FL=1